MDYFRWRQADCHINNLFNTCFHSLQLIGTTLEFHQTRFQWLKQWKRSKQSAQQQQLADETKNSDSLTASSDSASAASESARKLWTVGESHEFLMVGVSSHSLPLSLISRFRPSASQQTDSGAKNEVLFARFGINYNEQPQRWRKGSIIMFMPRVDLLQEDSSDDEKIRSWQRNSRVTDAKDAPYTIAPDASLQPLCSLADDIPSESSVQVWHCDVISDAFWTLHPHLTTN